VRRRAEMTTRLLSARLGDMAVKREALGRVVAIANGKGGVGKTSLATTLAGMAAEAGYKILIIDLDPQGNVGKDLGYTGAGPW